MYDTKYFKYENMGVHPNASSGFSQVCTFWKWHFLAGLSSLHLFFVMLCLPFTQSVLKTPKKVQNLRFMKRTTIRHILHYSKLRKNVLLTQSQNVPLSCLSQLLADRLAEAAYRDILGLSYAHAFPQLGVLLTVGLPISSLNSLVHDPALILWHSYVFLFQKVHKIF